MDDHSTLSVFLENARLQLGREKRLKKEDLRLAEKVEAKETIIRDLDTQVRRLKVGRCETRRLLSETQDAFLAMCRRAVYEKIYTTLPREIRDWIYELMVGRVSYSHEITKPKHGEHYDDKVFDISSTGFEIRKEIAEAWYRVTNHCFHDSRLSLQGIPYVLTKDVWDVGLRPFKLIKYVTVALIRLDWSAGHYWKSVYDNMTQLARLKEGAHITIRIVYSRIQDVRESTLNLLEHIVPAMQCFENAGHRVNLIFAFGSKIHAFKKTQAEYSVNGIMQWVKEKFLWKQ
ncbi:hypothetical protein BDV96DRAFT_644566 [Lophiotrema nucula]|uniref:Uncharacterized protein n=1 Tax=Lophiotrema nucula TaxID=690887 RepID=A0A6A5ZDX9_9PLEO|nr:hypothetical protein BDV96DRAFT_644566 [Lophiotrema nucula]